MKLLDTYTTITARDVIDGDVIKLGNWTEGLQVEGKPLVRGAFRWIHFSGNGTYKVHGNDFVSVLVRYDESTI